MRNVGVIVVLFAATSCAYPGCGPSRLGVVDAPAAKNDAKGQRSSTASSSTAGSGERGRKSERGAGDKLPRLFSPIRTDLDVSGVASQTTPRGTVQVQVPGLAALPRARERVHSAEAGHVLTGADFQEMWIGTYSLLFKTIELLEKMRSILYVNHMTLEEIKQARGLAPAGLPLQTEAGIDKFSKLHAQWLTLHKQAHDVGMIFYAGESKLPAEPFLAHPPLQITLNLTIQLQCEKCPKVWLWKGDMRKRPFCCFQSLLVRHVQALSARDGFDYEAAQEALQCILTTTQAMHKELNFCVAQLKPDTRALQQPQTFIICMPKIG